MMEALYIYIHVQTNNNVEIIFLCLLNIEQIVYCVCYFYTLKLMKLNIRMICEDNIKIDNLV